MRNEEEPKLLVFLTFIVTGLACRNWFLYFDFRKNRGRRQEGFIKKLFLKDLENSQENICVGVSFDKVVGWRLFIPRLQWSIFTSRRAECKINLHLFAKPQKLLRRLGNPFLATGLFLYPKNIKKRLVLFNIFRHFKKLSVLKNFHKLSVTLICIFFKIQLIQNI